MPHATTFNKRHVLIQCTRTNERTHARTHTRTHTHTHARSHTHTHTHTHSTCICYVIFISQSTRPRTNPAASHLDVWHIAPPVHIKTNTNTTGIQHKKTYLIQRHKIPYVVRICIRFQPMVTVFVFRKTSVRNSC